jgi:hypothetical protein
MTDTRPRSPLINPPSHDAADARFPSVRASNHLRRGSLHAPLTDRTDRARGEQLG